MIWNLPKRPENSKKNFNFGRFNYFNKGAGSIIYLFLNKLPENIRITIDPDTFSIEYSGYIQIGILPFSLNRERLQYL
jgi:hypothetical protein